MKNVLKTGLALAACVGLGSLAFAAVVVDENGVGFVGKGDVQDAYGWNNAQLQANAHLLQFRFTATTTATWECEQWQDHPQQGERFQHTNSETTIADVAANIAYDARKNKQGQITGFNLNGFGAVTTIGGGLAPGTCPEPHGNIFYVFVEGSLVTEDTDEGTLEVTINGIDWTAIGLEVDQGE